MRMPKVFSDGGAHCAFVGLRQADLGATRNLPHVLRLRCALSESSCQRGYRWRFHLVEQVKLMRGDRQELRSERSLPRLASRTRHEGDSNVNQRKAMKSQITRWNPMKEMQQFQNRLNSLWNWDPLVGSGKQEDLAVVDWTPNVDIIEDEKEFLVKAELPDMKREDVKVTVEDGVLAISGERKQEKEEKNKHYHRIESEYGSFVRSFTLPAATVGSKVTAEFKDGVLRVHLPKDIQAAASKAVEIKVT